MRDLPDGRTLLAFARDVLLEDLLPLLPPERRLDARLIANCMAIAAREAAADPQREGEIVAALATLYEATSSGSAPSPALPRVRGRGESASLPRPQESGDAASPRDPEGRVEADSLPRMRGRVRVGVEADDSVALYRRFARDLRIGAFEISERRASAARAILWQMTIERLRLANPRFLAANGLGGPKG